ncbi:hypothetical protein GYA13_04325 [Candidatus Kuenenbacteria bacterium]|nr:hypothetical protein [Candidatus Kuenenbacteria bacterium]
MKKINKIAKIAFIFFVLASVAMPTRAAVDIGINYAAQVGLGTSDLRNTAVGVIQSLLGILGILALVIVLIGGFKWMTSAGNEEGVSSAKKTIAAGIVGLAIILFAYAIVSFVFNVVGAV